MSEDVLKMACFVWGLIGLAEGEREKEKMTDLQMQGRWPRWNGKALLALKGYSRRKRMARTRGE